MKTEWKYKIKITNSLCTGCQACVLACSYHHSQKFGLNGKSSMIVFKNNNDGKVEIKYDQTSCDMCPDEDIPLCMQFCPMKAINFIRTKK